MPGIGEKLGNYTPNNGRFDVNLPDCSPSGGTELWDLFWQS